MCYKRLQNNVIVILLEFYQEFLDFEFLISYKNNDTLGLRKITSKPNRIEYLLCLPSMATMRSNRISGRVSFETKELYRAATRRLQLIAPPCDPIKLITRRVEAHEDEIETSSQYNKERSKGLFANPTTSLNGETDAR